jgi:hypothetical protein
MCGPAPKPPFMRLFDLPLSPPVARCDGGLDMAAPVYVIVKVQERCCRERVEAGAESWRWLAITWANVPLPPECVAFRNSSGSRPGCAEDFCSSFHFRAGRGTIRLPTLSKPETQAKLRNINPVATFSRLPLHSGTGTSAKVITFWRRAYKRCPSTLRVAGGTPRSPACAPRALAGLAKPSLRRAGNRATAGCSSPSLRSA